MKLLIVSILCFVAVVINVTSDDTNDLMEIKRLLRSGHNIDDLNYVNLGLVMAAAKGQSSIVKFLMDSGANINFHNGPPPIYYASFNGQVPIVELLIKYGVDVNIIHNEWTPLNAAARQGYLRIVELLLNAGADVNFQNGDGETPLYSATIKGHEDVVALLLEKGADFTIQAKGGWSPLHRAVEKRFVAIIESLRRKGANVDLRNNNNRTPYDIARGLGNQQIIDILIPPSMSSCKTFHAAAEEGEVQKIKELLANGTDVNILDNGGRTPLFIAAEHGHFDAVKVLIEHGAHIDKKNQFGRAPIFEATLNGHYNVVELLAQNGAQISIRKYDGWTPLNMAAKEGYLRIVELLLSKGASVDARTFAGETPLYSAAMEGHKDVVQILIEHGADVNLVEDNGGWSPLMRAIEKGFEDIVEILVKKKPKAFLKNKNNASAWNIARKEQNLKILKLLEKAPRVSDDVCQMYGQVGTPRIFGGDNAINGEFPAMAALGYRGSNPNEPVYMCGGTVISDQFVLTAAHCLYGPKGKPIVVRVGTVSLLDQQDDAGTPLIFQIKKIIAHPDYNTVTKWNDIALIRVSKKFPNTDYVSRACLHTKLGDEPSKLWVSGWGIRDPDRPSMSTRLYKANVTSMSLSDCRSNFSVRGRNHAFVRSGFIEGQYCTSGGGVADSCEGDSGGPLQYFGTNTTTVVGIVSFGDSCGTDQPSIYTRVAYYLDWIEELVWSDLIN